MLRICPESRLHYIRITNTTFAFHTYVNFKTQTIYVPKLDDTHQWESFLQYEFTPKIESLAMQKDLFVSFNVAISLDDGHGQMRATMPGLRQTTVVFNDDWAIRGEGRPCEDIWFRDLSANQQRRNSAVGYVKQYTKVIEERISQNLDERFAEGLRRMNYRLVVVEICHLEDKWYLEDSEDDMDLDE
jgi:hypothetical protein